MSANDAALYKGVVLMESINYADRKLSISMPLMLKDLKITEPVILSKNPSPDDILAHKRQRQAFARAIKSISFEVREGRDQRDELPGREEQREIEKEERMTLAESYRWRKKQLYITIAAMQGSTKCTSRINVSDVGVCIHDTIG
nr:hypothetical protein L204_03916 [Cryptococcus depauperatus CBS 7855]